jgi:hypothetical protein
MRMTTTILAAARLIALLLAPWSLEASESRLTLSSATPSPNYSLTADENDIEQLTDGETSRYPIWLDRASVGWAQRTPVLLRGRLRQGDAGTVGATLQLLVAKGVYAGVYPPRRIDAYCGNDKDGWRHVGVNDSAAETVPDRSIAWIDVDIAGKCQAELALVMHASGAFLMIDEITVQAGSARVVKAEEVQSSQLSTAGLTMDSVAKLQSQLMGRQAQRDRAAFDVEDMRESRAWLANPWLDLSVDKQLVRSGSNRTLGVSVSGKSAAQYIVAIANGSPVQQRYTVNAMSDTAGVADVSRLVPVLAADGRIVYDPLVPLAENAISIEPQSVEYLWFQHADVAGDGVVNVSVSSPDGWRENLDVVLHTFNDSSVRQELMPDVGVWAYSSDIPVWASVPKSDVVRELRDAGVNVLVVHPDHIPLPGSPESWLVREELLRADLRLFKGGRTVLLYLAWDDRLEPVVKSRDRLHSDIDQWLARIKNVLRSEGYGYEDWALYPIDEPVSADYQLLSELGTWIKSADPKVRLYANPGRIADGDFRSGEDLSALIKLVDIWQPQTGVTADFLVEKLEGKPRWWIYQVGDAPAKGILPLCYRKLAWDADRYGARGFGVWSFSDTGGTSAWSDLDGVRPDWALVYESPGGVISSRRWEAFKAGIQDYQQLAACRSDGSSSDKTETSFCVDLRRNLSSEFGAVACR